MLIPAFSGLDTIDGAKPMFQYLSKGGVAAATATLIPGVVCYVLPQNPKRKIACIQSSDKLASIILSPDPENSASGFLLDSMADKLELSLPQMLPIITSGFTALSEIPAELQIVVFQPN